MKVLHLTSHMGGGVGKVLSHVTSQFGRFNQLYEHEIVLLEKPEQEFFVNVARAGGVRVSICPDVESLVKKLHEADIVQLEWWHHPVMAQFIANFPQTPVRLVVWCHISGCSLPRVKPEFVKNTSCFIFTSPYSLENPLLSRLGKEYLEANTRVVFSSGGFEDVEHIERVKENHFNIGYLGTLNFCKLHPEFVEFCEEINIPDAKILMVGEASTRIEIEKLAREKGMHSQFEFVGYTSEIRKQLSRFDVFGYPLNPDHYGTTENALLEAMAGGIPPVVLKQCTEKYLVRNMETGIVVSDKKEYGEAIRYLYNNPKERRLLGENAREHVLERFSLKNTIEGLAEAYDSVMGKRKEVFDFRAVFGDTPSQWFMSCLGEEESAFEKSIGKFGLSDREIAVIEKDIVNCKRILKENTKSSVLHFHNCFPEDPWLAYWASLVNCASSS